jgi:hypothetical protein
MSVKFSDNLNDPDPKAFESMRSGAANGESSPCRRRNRDMGPPPNGNRSFTIPVKSHAGADRMTALDASAKQGGRSLSVRLSGF